MVNSRNKGASGEREFAKWLKDKLDLKEMPERNLEQVRKGGADIMNCPPFIFEVKRCEVVSKRKWWDKLKEDAKGFDDLCPVVAYRRNRQPWRFLIPFFDFKGFVQLEAEEAIEWMKYELCEYEGGEW